MPASHLPRSVYVHFPWCLKKCPYCDFLSIPGEREQIPHQSYADAVIGELEQRVAQLRAAEDNRSSVEQGSVAFDGAHARRGQLASLFIGGGTPSLWEPEQLARVVDAVLQAFSAASKDVEITVECNPSSFDAARAADLYAAGVNRVSIGVQSLNAERLAFLGRLHDGPSALRALRAALEQGFERVSADVIYGVAGQSVREAVEEVTRVAETGVSHLSAYTLTIEPGTQFGALARQKRLPLLGEDQVADSFLAVDQNLTDLGFEHYEISNFARLGHVATHNLGYWRGREYLGLGCGAWGTVVLGGRRLRYRNTPAVERYLKAYQQADPQQIFPSQPNAWVSDVEVIDANTQIAERLMLGLRLSEGIDLTEFNGHLALDDRRLQAIDDMSREGRLELSDNRLRIPRQHWLFADGIISELM